MFAALQKASWNWVPVTVSEHLISKKNQTESKTKQPQKEMVWSDRNEIPGKNEKWFEIPLSSDDEDHISPRGVLQFRKISCSETTGKESDYESEGPILSFDVANVCQQQEIAQHSIRQDGKLNNHNFNVTISQLSTRDYEFPEKNDAEFAIKKHKNLDSGDAEIHLRNLQNNEPKANEANEIAEAKVGLQIGKMDEKIVERCEKNMPSASISSVKLAHDAKCGTDGKMNELLNVETQTITVNREDFSSTKIALQRQLSDALSALDLTRNQANALRDRLRTYTSSMRQQAGDLRESSRSLNHALDKAMEYKTKWKDETKRREVMEKRLNELEKEAKDSQKVLAMKTDEIKSCHDVLDELGRLVECDDISTASLHDKVSHVSTKVRGLLELMERVQADACLASIKNVVEMKECLEKYEEEKKKWEKLQKNSGEIFSKKLQKLDTEKCFYQEELKHARASNEELKSCYELKLRKNEAKNMQLQKRNDKERALEETIKKMQARLTDTISALESSSKENNNLRRSFQSNHAKFNEEKIHLEKAITTLQQKLRDRAASKVESSVQCNLSHGKNERLSGSQSPLRSSANATRDLECENERLLWNIKQLEESHAELNNRYLYSRDEYDRLFGDFRHLNRTCHKQQVSVQHLRLENASLNRLVEKLERTIESHKAKTDENKSPEGSEQESPSVQVEHLAIEKARSRNNSVSDDTDSRLETIAESSSEENRENFTVTNTASYQVNVLTPNTAIVRPYQHIPETVWANFSKSSIHEDNSTVSRNEVKQQNSRPSRSRFAQTNRRRLRKSHQSNRPNKFPVWRQENPENQFSISNVSNSNGENSSEDVFINSFNSPSVNSSSAYSVDASEQNDTLYCPNNYSRGKRLIGIPMQEDVFQRMLDQPMHDNSSSIECSYSIRMSCEEHDQSSINSHKFTLDDDDTKCLHSTLLFPSSRSSSLDSEPNFIDDNPVKGDGETELHYLINYRGVTFDAVTFNLTKMRQISWEVGCSESEVELNKFIDFLAEMASKLNADPQWKCKHALGKSSDWIGLKGLF